MSTTVMKNSCVLLVTVLLAVNGWHVAGQTCTSFPNCGTVNTTACPRAFITCNKTDPPSCPTTPGVQVCGIISAADGCGGTLMTDCGTCPNGQACIANACACASTTCTAGITYTNGTLIVGTCSNTSPANTVPAGNGTCPAGCGPCNLPSFELCPAKTNGGLCAGGKCGCFLTKTGANCKANNFLFPGIAPTDPSDLGPGGGCEENLCNAAAQQNNAKASASCCPSKSSCA